MVMIGCTPKGRVTEQHDIFFGIADSLQLLIPQIHKFWPEAAGKFHIDAWREVTIVDNYCVEVEEKVERITDNNNLYFLNLGGYKPEEFEEFHYKILTVATDLSKAVKIAKKTAFYKHCGFEGAVTHIDDKYGIDVDDAHKVTDLLNSKTKLKYQLKITVLAKATEADKLHIGYLKLKSI